LGVGASRAARRIVTVEEARRLARRRLPSMVFDYIDGAAEGEITMRANRCAFDEVGFRPSMATAANAPGADLHTTVLGSDVSMPLLLAPVGFTRAMDPVGDVAAARAAHDAGTVAVMSTMSGQSLEAVAAAGERTGWFQLYGVGGRVGSEQLVTRARAAGFKALVVTVDTPIPGNRERDLRHGASLPLRFDRSNVRRFAPRVLTRPRWLYDFARDGFSMELMLTEGLGDPEHPMSSDEALIHWVLNPVTWDDFEWIRAAWDGPVAAKGVVSVEDARRAVDAGADAVIVSNHGGRQLDGVPATLAVLGPVVDAVGAEVEVLMDGGVRRGSDVVKAVALGARAVLVGRAWAYGLGAAGEPGVRKVLGLFKAEIDRTMRLLGCRSVAELDRSRISVPESFRIG
jgi:isopentenyl diphosphate isomerase/L-lactate dehydrogenase-like FMN-dependent dehydrogenase